MVWRTKDAYKESGLLFVVKNKVIYVVMHELISPKETVAHKFCEIPLVSLVICFRFESEKELQGHV